MGSGTWSWQVPGRELSIAQEEEEEAAAKKRRRRRNPRPSVTYDNSKGCCTRRENGDPTVFFYYYFILKRKRRRINPLKEWQATCWPRFSCHWALARASLWLSLSQRINHWSPQRTNERTNGWDGTGWDGWDSKEMKRAAHSTNTQKKERLLFFFREGERERSSCVVVQCRAVKLVTVKSTVTGQSVDDKNSDDDLLLLYSSGRWHFM